METAVLFNKKASPTTEITLDQLKETALLVNSAGKLPSTRPKEHKEIFMSISDMLTEANQPHTVEPIIVANSEAGTNGLWGTPDQLSSWVLNRLIGRITLDGVDVSDEESKSAIAITYDPKGIVMAYGQHVNVCSNMSIMGGKCMRTWGKGSSVVSFDKMMELAQKWISERKAIREHDIQIFNSLKDVRIDRSKQMAELLGNMLKAACAQYNDQNDDIIRIGDVTGLAQMYTKAYPEERSDEITGWEFYNMGTNLLTHNKSNMTNKLQRVSMFGDFIVENLLN